MHFIPLKQLDPVNIRSRILPIKCCGCVGIRRGGALGCVVWALLSFYFAALGFMGRSPFFSHLERAPLVIYGVLNLAFGIASLLGLFFIGYMTIFTRVKLLSRILWLFATLVIGDTLINFILFVVNKSKFESWCIETSISRLEQNPVVPNPTQTLDIGNVDYYNCQRLYIDEVKWSLLAALVMCMVYIHWALVITAFVHDSFIIVAPRITGVPKTNIQLSSPVTDQSSTDTIVHVDDNVNIGSCLVQNISDKVLHTISPLYVPQRRTSIHTFTAKQGNNNKPSDDLEYEGISSSPPYDVFHNRPIKIKAR
ncbi:hypothetical protein J3Q64DRAFT_1752634 [Phycomyces blakesleeanus]|uniref:MARVEL domain-containing protein n=1 Tax=Phycomyces blakesleeanus TaxID=4837 RepID=A0ABR3AV26_PHYBL